MHRTRKLSSARHYRTTRAGCSSSQIRRSTCTLQPGASSGYQSTRERSLAATCRAHPSEGSTSAA